MAVTGVVGLLVAAALILVSGAFVAAEFSLVAVRRAAVDELAATGQRRARLVERQLRRLPFWLTVARFAITSATVLLGYLVDRSIGRQLLQPVVEQLGMPERTTLMVSVVLAFLGVTLLQLVVGGLVPRNLGLAHPLAVARTVAPASWGLGILLGPLIRAVQRLGGLLTRKVLRVEPPGEHDGGHSLDDLGRIIAASGERGTLTTEQTQLLRRAVELGDRRVGEVMVPRPDVVWLHVDDHLSELRAAAARTGHSRFPVRGANEDEVLGSVHVKDLLGVPSARHASTTVGTVVDPLLVVPEAASLRRLLTELRREQRTFAMVVDEYGGTAGIVTLEDVLEQLVGDIEDEFDEAGAPVRRGGAGRHLVDGALRVERLPEVLGIELPDGEYETLAGFLLDQLGHIPEPGELVVHGDVEFTVTKVEAVRVVEVAVRRLPRPEGEP